MSAVRETLDISEALRLGWKTTRENLKPLLVISLTGAFVALLIQGLSRPRGYGDPVLMLGLQALQVAVATVMARAALMLHDGKRVELSKLGELLGGYFTFFATTLICELVVAFGLVLLIVPGLYWATRYCFAPLLALDHKLDPFTAMGESARLTEGERWRLFGFGWALIGINLLGALALGVGLLFTVPVSFLAAVHVMRHLQVRTPLPLPSFTPVGSH